MKRGEIKFNTPESWVKYAEEVGEGRGDFGEGTLAFYHKNDIENMKLINYKFKPHEPLLRYRVSDRVYLKKARDMEVNCTPFIRHNTNEWGAVHV